MADPPGPGAVTAMREGHDGHHGPPETPGVDTDAVGGGIDLLAPVALVALLAAAVLYLVGLRRTRDRSPWPRPRTAAWMAGLLCAGVGLVGPFAALAHSSFPVHMAGHVLVGMLAPLLLVLGRPVTLALRALPVPRARCPGCCAAARSGCSRIRWSPAPSMSADSGFSTPHRCSP